MPDELMRFIQSDTYSLLIKGYAGTGKTTLALTILKALESKSNFFYISTRISPKQLFQYYPWLARFVEQPKTASPGEDHTVMPSFEDARLDEPESLFERITNQLMDIKSPIIIIDSWDAIASFMDKEARLNNERVLQTWRERAGAKLIFISEHPEDTTLDFLVDGIVELKQTHYENARMREIFLLKLRGVRIDRTSHFYTLENSVFRSFSPYMPIKPQQHPRKAAGGFVAPKPSSERVPSGYHALDCALGGGFPRKGVVLLELDSHVNTAVAMAFLGRMASNFVSTGNSVLFQPFDWMDPGAIAGHMGQDIAGRKEFRIMWTSKVSGMPNVIAPEGKQKPFEQSLAALDKIRQKDGGRKLLLNIIGTDMLQKLGAKDVRTGMENLLSATRAGADLSIAVVRRSQEDMLEYLSEVSDMHLRLLMINGTLFLQPLVPASTICSVVFDDSGYQISLEPVV